MTNLNRLIINLHEAKRKNGGAVCEQVPHIFFPEDQDDYDQRQREIKQAKAICKTCPIFAECFSYAVNSKEAFGIWAATTPEDRLGFRKKRVISTFD